ncbi:hypothetical protein SUGI_0988370 [Cryptomeria japonica]|nr:hypothetical protein SUGI_0988370 [Cryptomeria japonica]
MLLCVVLVLGMMGYSIAQAPAGSPVASPKLSPVPSPAKKAASPSPSAAPAVSSTAPAPALSVTPTAAEAPGPSTVVTGSSGGSAMGSHNLAVFGAALIGGAALLL